MNFVLNTDVPFEMITVRYDDHSGTTDPVIGRHGGEFYNWGDYSTNLFEMNDFFITMHNPVLVNSIN
jgi:purine nucleosidase